MRQTRQKATGIKREVSEENDDERWSVDRTPCWPKSTRNIDWGSNPTCNIWVESDLTRPVDSGGPSVPSSSHTSDNEAVRVFRAVKMKGEMPLKVNPETWFWLFDEKATTATMALEARIQDLWSKARDGDASQVEKETAVFLDRHLRRLQHYLAGNRKGGSRSADTPTNFSWDQAEAALMEAVLNLEEPWQPEGLRNQMKRVRVLDATIREEMLGIEDTLAEQMSTFALSITGVKDSAPSTEPLWAIWRTWQQLLSNQKTLLQCQMKTLKMEQGQPSETIGSIPRTHSPDCDEEDWWADDGNDIERVADPRLNRTEKRKEGGWAPLSIDIPWETVTPGQVIHWRKKTCSILVDGNPQVIILKRNSYIGLDDRASALITRVAEAIDVNVQRYVESKKDESRDIDLVAEMEWTLYAGKVLRRQQFLLQSDGSQTVKNTKKVVAFDDLLKELRTYADIEACEVRASAAEEDLRNTVTGEATSCVQRPADLRRDFFYAMFRRHMSICKAVGGRPNDQMRDVRRGCKSDMDQCQLQAEATLQSPELHEALAGLSASTAACDHESRLSEVPRQDASQHQKDGCRMMDGKTRQDVEHMAASPLTNGARVTTAERSTSQDTQPGGSGHTDDVDVVQRDVQLPMVAKDVLSSEQQKENPRVPFGSVPAVLTQHYSSSTTDRPCENSPPKVPTHMVGGEVERSARSALGNEAGIAIPKQSTSQGTQPGSSGVSDGFGTAVVDTQLQNVVEDILSERQGHENSEVAFASVSSTPIRHPRSSTADIPRGNTPLTASMDGISTAEVESHSGAALANGARVMSPEQSTSQEAQAGTSGPTDDVDMVRMDVQLPLVAEDIPASEQREENFEVAFASVSPTPIRHHWSSTADIPRGNPPLTASMDGISTAEVESHAGAALANGARVMSPEQSTSQEAQAGTSGPTDDVDMVRMDVQLPLVAEDIPASEQREENSEVAFASVSPTPIRHPWGSTADMPRENPPLTASMDEMPDTDGASHSGAALANGAGITTSEQSTSQTPHQGATRPMDMDKVDTLDHTVGDTSVGMEADQFAWACWTGSHVRLWGNAVDYNGGKSDAPPTDMGAVDSELVRGPSSLVSEKEPKTPISQDSPSNAESAYHPEGSKKSCDEPHNVMKVDAATGSGLMETTQPATHLRSSSRGLGIAMLADVAADQRHGAETAKALVVNIDRAPGRQRTLPSLTHSPAGSLLQSPFSLDGRSISPASEIHGSSLRSGSKRTRSPEDGRPKEKQTADGELFKRARRSESTSAIVAAGSASTVISMDINAPKANATKWEARNGRGDHGVDLLERMLSSFSLVRDGVWEPAEFFNGLKLLRVLDIDLFASRGIQDVARQSEYVSGISEWLREGPCQMDEEVAVVAKYLEEEVTRVKM